MRKWGVKNNLITGIIAGIAGGVAMKAVVTRIDSNSFGLSAATDARAAHELWRRMDLGPLSDRQARQIGAAMHYGFAALTGAAYSVAAPKFPLLRSGRGAAFGIALWALGDEVAMFFSGLDDPLRTPAFSHFSALNAHVLFGMILDAAQLRRET